MRVLHVIPSVSGLRGGPSQAVLELAALQQAGCEVQIATTNDHGPGLMDVPLGDPVAFQGAPVRFFPRSSPPLRPLREFAYSGAFAPWLREHLREFDLLHVHSLFSYLPSTAMRIARRMGAPYIVRPSGLLCRWSLQQSRWRKRLFLALQDRANLNGSAAIEFTAEHERDEAAGLGLAAPSFVMPYGLHLPARLPEARTELRGRRKLPPDEPLVLFLSRLHPKKGVQHLIPAAASLAGLHRFTVLVAGSGAASYEAELRGLVAQHGLTHRVRFVGFAEGEFKDLLLQGADVFVLPSYSESFAIAVMEALAVGLPVVTTPGVPLASLVENHDLGWICAAEPADLAEAMRCALASLRDDAQVAARAARARSLVARNFTWEIIAARMHQVYEALLHKQRPPSFELGLAGP